MTVSPRPCAASPASTAATISSSVERERRDVGAVQVVDVDRVGGRSAAHDAASLTGPRAVVRRASRLAHRCNGPTIGCDRWDPHRHAPPAQARRLCRMPWKNGGGQTTEIAAHPAGASLADFDWRVSIAEINADGPFSAFAGVDRTLVLLAGAGVRLTGTTHMAELRVPYEPYAFSGDDATACRLVDGPVRDFNLMLRRGCVRGRVVVVREASARIEPARWRACHAAVGAVECLVAGSPADRDRAGSHGSSSTTPTWRRALRSPSIPSSPDAVALVAVIEARRMRLARRRGRCCPRAGRRRWRSTSTTRHDRARRRRARTATTPRTGRGPARAGDAEPALARVPARASRVAPVVRHRGATTASGRGAGDVCVPRSRRRRRVRGDRGAGVCRDG